MKPIFSFFFLAHASSLVMAGLLIILLASAFSFLATYIFLRVSQLAPKEMNNVVSSMTLVAINLGGFLSPYTMGLIANLSGNSTPASSLVACGVIVAILLACVLVGQSPLGKRVLETKKKEQENGKISNQS